jgi:signal peptidase I
MSDSKTRQDGPETIEGAGASAESEASSRQPGAGERLWEQVSTLVIAVVIALGIRAFVIEPFRIPSESMLPTLLVGDHLFVNKFVYGPRLPFTDWRLPGLREPARGDVVVFSVARKGGAIQPVDKHPDWARDDFVKRVVGLPGDRIEVRGGGRLYVNGERVEVEDLEETFLDESGTPLRVKSERLNGCSHAVLDDYRKPGPQESPIVVPEGRYFMMGDNRDNSRDSRDWGTVRFEEMKGPAFILYWSWAKNGNFLEFLNPVNWFTVEKRWDRVFQRVKCDAVSELSAPAGNSAER